MLTFELFRAIFRTFARFLWHFSASNAAELQLEPKIFGAKCYFLVNPLQLDRRLGRSAETSLLQSGQQWQHYRPCSGHLRKRQQAAAATKSITDRQDAHAGWQIRHSGLFCALRHIGADLETC